MIKTQRVRWARGGGVIAVTALAVGLATAQSAAQQQWPTKQWPAAKLNDVGVDAEPLDAFDAELAAGQQLVGADWVKQSVAPSITVGDGPVKYGYKWWLFPYREGQPAWAGSDCLWCRSTTWWSSTQHGTS